MKIRISNHHKSARILGFSLLEILATLFIIALVSSIALPNFVNPTEKTDTVTFVSQIANQLKTAKTKAISEQQATSFILDLEKRVFGVERDQFSKFPKSVTLTFKTGVTLAEHQAGGIIVFFPDGTSSGGRIEITFQGRSHRIDIHWLTGKITRI